MHQSTDQNPPASPRGVDALGTGLVLVLAALTVLGVLTSAWITAVLAGLACVFAVSLYLLA